MVHELAGKIVDTNINIPRILSSYYAFKPDPQINQEKVSFGTSGHRGSSINTSFNENHILAISQAVADYRKKSKIDGPLFIGFDTHALSEAAFISAVEVFAANNIELMISQNLEYTPTPAVSLAILNYNKNRKNGLADGVIITPSHNPPKDGGFKYNPPSGGPADAASTQIIEGLANKYLTELNKIKRMDYKKALNASSTHEHDYIAEYVNDLENVIDMQAIAASKIKIGVDPMGGAGIAYWQPIVERYGLDITVTNSKIDPSFSFMPRDKDGIVRMDCSSPYAMANLLKLKDNYDIAFGNDPDYDRHGIVSSSGLMNPNHYLAVAINYLFQNRNDWPSTTAIGKTLVSSSIIDRLAKKINRKLVEVPVGFKWFVDGLKSGEYGFAGEESAGASFLRKDATVWTSDKDGIIMDLLAAEIMVKTNKDPSQHYQEISQELGRPYYKRISAKANKKEKEILKNLKPELIKTKELANEEIQAKLTKAPGNHQAIGGLKVVSQNAWFAARPSGTEDIYKIYAESFLSEEHLQQVLAEAQEIVDKSLKLAD